MRNQIVYDGLVRLFGRSEVAREWDIAKNSRDAISRKPYCPRLDFAVFTWNTDRDIDVNNDRINAAWERNRDLILWLENADRKRIESSWNRNPVASSRLKLRTRPQESTGWGA
jgi:hypothetical protein